VFLRLGVAPATDYSVAGRTMAFDIRHNVYSSEILGHAGIDAGLLAEAVPSGTVIGHISRETAADLGLPSGAAVVAGGFDQHCAALARV